MVCGHRRCIVFTKSEMISKALQIVWFRGQYMADFKLNVVKGFSLRVNAAGVTVEKKSMGQ